MRKIWILVSFILMFFLVSCQSFKEDLNSLRPTAVAPAITENEKSLMEFIDLRKQSVVAIVNNYATDDVSNISMRRGSGTVIKKVSGLLTHTYTILTTEWVVENAASVLVYISQSRYVTGTVNHLFTDNLEESNNMALITIQTDQNLLPVELELVDEKSIEFDEVFSIGTPISTAYFNYPTRPAIVSGVIYPLFVHASPLSYGQLGSPVFLKSNGQFVGMNIEILTNTSNDRPINSMTIALHVNRIIELLEEK
ncbi:S1 family peptidase [Acholeplasma equifetale]|uniref:S1 family peptidase n=1 Tax=Acholeplasma equifetale TaxID=264634 RepID=UPI00047C93BD|nr:serine protease [Acholeplasma equifetale]